MDRVLTGMLIGALLFGVVFGIGGVTLLNYLGYLTPSNAALVGGSPGIGTSAIGIIVGATIGKRI